MAESFDWLTNFPGRQSGAAGSDAPLSEAIVSLARLWVRSGRTTQEACALLRDVHQVLLDGVLAGADLAGE